MRNARQRLQFDLDDLLWDARLSRYTLQQINQCFFQLAEKYRRCTPPSEFKPVKQLLDDFQAKLDSGAVTAFVGSAA